MDDCDLTACQPQKGGDSKINSSNAFINIDIGKRACVVCIMDDDGNILERTKHTNKSAAAGAFAKYAAVKYKNCSAVLEATSNYSFKMQLALEGSHISFKITNLLRLKCSQCGTTTKPPLHQAHTVRQHRARACFPSYFVLPGSFRQMYGSFGALMVSFNHSPITNLVIPRPD